MKDLEKMGDDEFMDAEFSHLIRPEDRAGLMARAKRRAMVSAAQRERLRMEIDARELIYGMVGIGRTLMSGYEPQVVPGEGDVGLYVKLDRDAIQRLKAAADVQGKLLAKVLPDLKSVEVVGDIDEEGRLVFNVNTGIVREGDGEEKEYPWN